MYILRSEVFDPRLVFKSSYLSALETALANEPNSEQIIQEIETNFCESQDFENTAWIHKQQLQCFSDA